LRLAIGGAAAMTLAATRLAAPAGADDPPAPQEVAGGLDNPRQLSFHNGRLFVAEAGVGGTAPCFEGPEGPAGPELCFGATGAITRIYHGRQQRVVRNLPSLAEEGGFAALGPADVSVVHRNRFAVTIGLGADPAVREDLPRLGKRLMGTIATGRLWTKTPRVAADLAAYEARTDKDGAGPDSNPTGLIRRHGGFVATDSGANTLVRAGTRGWVKALTVFGSPGAAPDPFDPTAPDIEIQPVPTSVAVGPDGAFYVSELTGFPFVPGLARIYRVVPGMPTQVYATGLTNVTDLAWHGDHLYAVQIADEGILNAPEDAPPMGSLVHVVPGETEHEAVAGPFPAPYGVAIRHDKAYVTTCSVCPDAGAVVKVPLD
jgi:hypothetical protein